MPLPGPATHKAALMGAVLGEGKGPTSECPNQVLYAISARPRPPHLLTPMLSRYTRDAVVAFYRWIWTLFYCEYALFPFI